MDKSNNFLSKCITYIREHIYVFSTISLSVVFGVIYILILTKTASTRIQTLSAGNVLTPSNIELNSEQYKDYTYLNSGEKTDKIPSSTSSPYEIKINRSANCITIYSKDDAGGYSQPFRSMTCSTGEKAEYTPLGEFTISSSYSWRKMSTGMYSKYSLKINQGIMIQSIPSYKTEDGNIDSDSFNKLGDSITMGSIWLTTDDAKWIYDNCPVGTNVIVYDNVDPGPLGKPSIIKIALDNLNCDWDPTEKIDANPWNSCMPTIIVSDMTVSEDADIDLLMNVKATDSCGNDVTSSVTISGNYDLKVPGKYDVTFSLTDALGRAASKTVILTVLNDGQNEPVETTTRYIPPATTETQPQVPDTNENTTSYQQPATTTSPTTASPEPSTTQPATTAPPTTETPTETTVPQTTTEVPTTAEPTTQPTETTSADAVSDSLEDTAVKK